MNFKMLFKIITFPLAITSFPFFLLASSSLKIVAITEIIDHPAADAVREGVISALRDNGYKEGKNLKIIYESAQGSPITAAQIAKKFVALKPDVLVPITTISAQTVAKANEKYSIPIVFAAVTDPINSGLVSSLAQPGRHITGAIDAVPIKQQFDVFRKILPHLKTLGVVYNPGDSSSVTPLKEAQESSKEIGVDLIESTVFKTSDVPAAIQQLAGKKVDAIFVPLDNTVLSAMESVLKITFQHTIPVLASDSDSVVQGALVSSGYTHFDTGYNAGKIAVAVLQGANPGDIPVAKPHSLSVYINTRSAAKLNIVIPLPILEAAKVKNGYDK